VHHFGLPVDLDSSRSRRLPPGSVCIVRRTEGAGLFGLTEFNPGDGRSAVDAICEALGIPELTRDGYAALAPWAAPTPPRASEDERRLSLSPEAVARLLTGWDAVREVAAATGNPGLQVGHGWPLMAWRAKAGPGMVLLFRLGTEPGAVTDRVLCVRDDPARHADYASRVPADAPATVLMFAP
jgi:hypothetical protein